MDTVSKRECEHDGCGEPVTGKATARFCSPTCRREHARLKGDGAARVWVPGRWKTARSPKPRSRRRNVIPGVDLTSPVFAVLDAAQAGKR